MISKEVFLKIKRCKEIGMTSPKIGKEVGMADYDVRVIWNLTEEEFDARVTARFGETYKYRPYVLSLLRLRPDIRVTTVIDRIYEEFPEARSIGKSSFYRMVKAVREENGYEKSFHRRTVMRDELPPGYEAQVDFGQMKMVDMYDRVVVVYFFCMVLSYSRMRFVFFSRKPFTTDTAIQAHNRAFRYFGGRTQTLLYDQDRVFVVSENRGNIILVKEFEEYVRRIGFGVVLCRPSDPQTKGKVENFVKNVKEGFLVGRIYTGIDSLNSAALKWLDETANQWYHGVTKSTPREMFYEESQKLIHVPPEEINLNYRTISQMNAVAYEECSYILPPKKAIPGMRVRIEERGDRLVFYEVNGGMVLYECKKGDRVGQVVSYKRNVEPEIPESDYVNQLRKIFDNDAVVDQFIEALAFGNPRYKNTQYSRILSVCKVYTLEQIKEGIDHCLKEDRCSSHELIAYLMWRYGLHSQRLDLNKYERKRCQEMVERLKEEMENGEH